MVQFKDYFLGIRKPPHDSVATAQKCMRAGGKHNDLDNVGYTSRHQTFFEMLGNFSFNSYWKREAINLSWNFLTKELALPKERLLVSVLKGDEETKNIWLRDFNLPSNRIIECGHDDNFWSMGDSGPCGPCTEIFWDNLEPVDGEQYLEIWNLVFMQYLNQGDGVLQPLPAKCIDTGMGLERLSSVLQGKTSNYEVDDIQFVCDAVRHLSESRSGVRYVATVQNEVAVKVIADHLRSCSMLISEGMVPGNQGRAYVLRRILRRAARYGHTLGLSQPFMAELYPVIAVTLGQAYPELVEREDYICKILTQEEKSFASTLQNALEYIENIFCNPKLLKDATIPSEEAFKLYDTYGLPLDLVEIVARERGWKVDTREINDVLKERSTKSKTWKGNNVTNLPVGIKKWSSTPTFIGYGKLNEPNATVTEIFKQDDKYTWISIDPCPFFSESGGQLGDRGFITFNGNAFQVVDCVSPYENAISLKLEVKADQRAHLPRVGSIVSAEVDSKWRRDIKKSHTATHLLHSALRRLLGSHVKQAGSRVEPGRLRFDFVHFEPLTDSEISEIEKWVNSAIYESVDIDTKIMGYEEAMEMNAIAQFQDNYLTKKEIRVVDAPGWSTELCGGTHVENTIQIGMFKIVSQCSISNGVRRLEAVTGTTAIEWMNDRSSILDNISELMKTKNVLTLVPKIEEVLKSRKSLKKDNEKLKQQLLDYQENQLVPGDMDTTNTNNDLEIIQEVKTVTTTTTRTTYKKREGIFSGKPLIIHHFECIDDIKLLRARGDKFRLEDPESIHCLISKDTIVLTTSEKTMSHLLKDVLNKLGARGMYTIEFF